MDNPPALGYDTRFGRGWISGVCSVALGALGAGAVLCLLFPHLLTTPEARAVYPMALVRFLIHLVLVAAFGLGAERGIEPAGDAGRYRRRARGGGRAARRLRGRGAGADRLRALRGLRLVPAQHLRPVARVRPARSPVGAAARARVLPKGLAHRSAAFRGEPPARAAHGAADPRPRRRLLPVGGGAHACSRRWPRSRSSCSSSRSWWWRTSRNTRSTVSSTVCPGCGASMRCTTRRRRSTGCGRARAST